MVRYEFSLCIGQANTDSGITVKCHDDGISFLIKLMVCRQVSKWRTKEEAFTIPEGSKAILKIKKPDNTKCLIGGTVKAAGVLFKSPPEAFTVAGVSEAEVSIYGADGRRATTATFNIDVPEECVCNCDVESEPYIDIIGEQIKEAQKAEAEAKAAAKAAMQAQVNAPKIGDNGNWFVWDADAGQYTDTGMRSDGNEIYVGAGELPRNCKLQIDPTGGRPGFVPIAAFSDADTVQSALKEKRLYSFAVIADTHVSRSNDVDEIFEKTIKHLTGRSDISFICHAGDVVDHGKETGWQTYEKIVAGCPMRMITGNHEQLETDAALVKKYTGSDAVYYTFEHAGDLFIMLNCWDYTKNAVNECGQYIPNSQLYARNDLIAITELFKEKKMDAKRIFVFHHTPLVEEHKRYFDVGAMQKPCYLPRSVFEGTTVFHGHTHGSFETHGGYEGDGLGFNSIHVPALCDTEQCYIVDVYKYGIQLRGYNALTKKYLPIADYWVSTT